MDIYSGIHENGYSFEYENKTYSFPFSSSFYAKLNENGKINIYGFNDVEFEFDNHSIIQIDLLLNDMNWYISTFSEKGINIYSDKELSEYLYTLPYNTKILIKNRFMIDGYYVYESYNKEYFGDIDHILYSNMKLFLCPISDHKVIYGKIKNLDGLIVRKEKEIYSSIVGILNYNATVYISKKDFTDIPSHQNIHRLQLANNQGWINAFDNNMNSTIEFIRYSHGNEKDYLMNIIDLNVNNPFITTKSQKCIICLHNDINSVFIHDSTGHSICCLTCANHIFEKNKKCPICRSDIEKIIQLF